MGASSQRVCVQAFVILPGSGQRRLKSLTSQGLWVGGGGTSSVIVDPVKNENMAPLVQKLEEFQDSDRQTSEHARSPSKRQARVTQVACPQPARYKRDRY